MLGHVGVVFIGAAVLLATLPAVPSGGLDTARATGPAAVNLNLDWTATTAMASYQPRFTGEAFSSPAVGDVTGDANPEVVVGSNSGALLIYDLAGHLVRSFATDSAADAVIASPALVDLNGDGKLDIVVGTIPANDATAGSTVSAFTGSGQRLWGRKTCRAPGTLCDVFATPAIGDINGDGVPDVVIGTQDTYVYALRGSDGADLPGWPVFLDDTTWSSASVADLNGDGRAEVVIASDLDDPTCSGHPELQPCSYGGLIRVLGDGGQQLARYNMPGEIPMSSPAVGDINGDGTLDIVIGAGLYFTNIGRPDDGARRLWAFDTGLHPLPGWPVRLGGRSMASPALADVDGNGSREVVTMAEDGAVSVWNGNGSPRWSRCARNANQPCGATNLPLNASPVVADVNNDGRQDVIAGNEGTLWAFDANTGSVLWQLVLWQPNLQPFALASTPTVVSVNGHARVFEHATIDFDKNSQHNAGDLDAVYSLTSPTALGPSAWPMFRHDTRRGGSAVPLPPPLPIEQTPYGKYVIRSYRDLLGRAPSSAELRFGVVVAASNGRRAFEQGLVYSNEWAGHVVHDLYATVIGREPDAEGLAYWTGRVRAGMAVRDVAIYMYGSPEYYNAHGGTPGGYVDAIYTAILGRAPDAAGRAYWIGEVNRRGTASVAADFYQSLESRQKRVTALYQQLLHRGTDPVGRDYWAGRLLTDDDLALALELVTSNEYFITS